MRADQKQRVYQVVRLDRAGMSLRAICRALGVSRRTVVRILHQERVRDREKPDGR